MISKEELLRIMPYSRDRVDMFLPHLNTSMRDYDIITPPRMAAFLAQVAHESGEFRYVRELYDGTKYDVGTLAARLGNTPEDDGDGEKYRGRGLIQITGRDNYRRCSDDLFGDERLLDEPELLETPEYACLSATWFWSKHKLNNLADQGDMRGITRVINGGYNGLDDRLKYYARALLVLQVDKL